MDRVDPCAWIELDMPQGKITLDKLSDANFSPDDVRQIVNHVVARERKEIVEYLETDEALEVLAAGGGMEELRRRIAERGEVKPKIRLVT